MTKISSKQQRSSEDVPAFPGIHFASCNRSSLLRVILAFHLLLSLTACAHSEKATHVERVEVSEKDRRKLRAVVAEHAREIHRCHQAAVQSGQGPLPPVEFVIVAKIDINGKAISVGSKDYKNVTAESSIVGCVEVLFRKFNFPERLTQDTFDFDYAMSFQPAIRK